MLLPGTAHADPITVFSNGFETNTAGWFDFPTVISRVPSGTNGIPSASGGHHMVVPGGSPTTGGAFTRWGEYRSVFPEHGYTATAKIYLDVNGPWANDTKFDWSVAVTKGDGAHLRDYIFNVGFYNAADVTGPGAGANRFVVSASNNSGGGNLPKTPSQSPVALTVSGWYVFEHQFVNDGGAMRANLRLLAPGGALVSSWTLYNPADLIGTVAGGNRYGWLHNNAFSSLAFDDTSLVYADPTEAPTILNATQGSLHLTIQSAVTAANAGDVIQVPPGTYTGNVSINKNVTLESVGGRDVTTIVGVSSAGSPGAVVVTGTTTGVTIGGVGKGFTIVGIDNGFPAQENAALYIQGSHTGLTIRGNDIQANGEAGLLAEYGATGSGWLIDGNIFSGQTFLGPNPAGDGFGQQFTLPNVPRSLVVLGNGGGALGTANLSGITFTNNQITGTAGGLNGSGAEQGNTLVTLDVAGSTISGNSFTGVTNRFAGTLRVRRPETDISGNTFSSAGLGANTNHLFVQNNTTPIDAIIAANTFDAVVYLEGSTTATPTIQAAINAAAPGQVVLVPAGVWEEDININKAITVKGAGPTTTTLVGQKGGDIATVRLASAGAVIEGFTITRDGNTVTDWNDSTLNSVGVAIQTIGGATIRGNVITGNRNGIDINNASGHSILNNVIADNRTGIIFRNQTDNLTVTENEIRDNWTVGVLFLDGSMGTNSPLQTAENSVFFNNNISGNWYGQIVDRASGGSLPVPGTLNLRNFSGNWLGTNDPEITTADSTEPGYAAQIPVAFGGSAVPPVVAPADILGAASANIDITPLLAAGLDTDVETSLGRGTFGFQGDFGSLVILGGLAQTGSVSRLEEALALVADGGAITALPGTPLQFTGVITQSVTIAGDFVLTASGFPSDATAGTALASFLNTLTPGSTLTAQMAGMSQDQVDAVNAHLGAFSGGAAVQVYRAGSIVDGYSTIQAAISDATTLAGDFVLVAAGTYPEDVLVNKAVTLKGAGPATTTIVGQKGGDSFTVRLASTGAILEGFTITREGNTVAEWNDPTLNSVGVHVQSTDGVTIRGNVIKGNRTGIDVNNCSGHSILNNIVANNHTGLIFRNQTDNLSVSENEIRDNRTVGVVFLDQSGGTNSPLQSALNSTFFNNAIHGNWHGQIVDRQAGGSLPTPGSVNLKNFSGNWLGTSAPVFTTANSAEPGYALLIPVAFGGTATPPAIPPADVLGAASANLDVTPLLVSGADTDIETSLGRGTHGFQGDFSELAVTQEGAQTGLVSREQEAQTLLAPGGSLAAPEISVEQPESTPLVDGSGTPIDFGVVLSGDSNALTFHVKNLGEADLGGLSATISGTDAGDFIVTAAPAGSVSEAGATTFEVTFAPTTGGAKTALLQIWSNDGDESPFDIVLNGTGNIPPVVTLEGDNPLVIEAALSYTDPGAAALDADEGSLTPVITSNTVVPHVAGSYEVVWTATDSLGGVGTATRTVQVVNTQGPQLVLPADITLPTQSLNGLVVTYPDAVATDPDGIASLTYSHPSGSLFPVGRTTVTVTVEDTGGNVTTDTFDVTVLPGALDKAAPVVKLLLPAAKTTTVPGTFTISGTLLESVALKSFTVKLNGVAQTVDFAPAFSPGVLTTWNVASAVAENGPNLIEIEAVDFADRMTRVTKTVTYTNNRAALAGTYQAWIKPSGTPTMKSTGRITLKITANGAFTGGVAIDGANANFKGTLDNSGTGIIGVGASQTARIPLKTKAVKATARKKAVPARSLGQLELTIDEINGLQGDLLDDAGTPVADFASAKLPYHAKAPVPAALLNRLTKGKLTHGIYNLVFGSKDQVPALPKAFYPQGDGYATVTLQQTGKVSFLGYLADGSKFTTTANLRADSTIGVFGYAYANRGAVGCDLTLADEVDSDLSATDVLWLRPAIPTAASYVYGWPSGIWIDAVGTKYAGNASADLGQGPADPVSGNAQLIFEEGLLPSPVSHAISVPPGAGKAAVIPPGNTNLQLSFAPATGAFSGKFRHQDGTLTVYRGIVLNKGSNRAGFGFFVTNGANGEAGGVSLEP